MVERDVVGSRRDEEHLCLNVHRGTTKLLVPRFPSEYLERLPNGMDMERCEGVLGMTNGCDGVGCRILRTLAMSSSSSA